MTWSYLVTRVETIRDGVLVNVKSRQPESQLILELRSKPLLDHIVATLDIQIFESHRICPEQLVSIVWHEGHTKQTSQVVSSWPRGNLKYRM